MKLSAVVQLMDSFSGQPIAGTPAHFELDKKVYMPLEKGQGFYAFADLADGAHHLKIACQGFFDGEATFPAMTFPLATPLADAIVVCELEPSPLYAYPSDMTLIRGRVLDKRNDEKPLADVSVDGTYADERGETHHSNTRSYGKGAYDGRYALALPGRLAVGSVAVELHFAKEGYAPVIHPVSVARGTTKIVDVEMQ